ncbi:hypothetical protein CIN_02380 [Commensalibacter intestini A911]|uniref:Uncharacterized protein n=1 Tax=Commensalibacter intestini A911 TaxID=1088868 RepID=G6EXR8_9PROT|nr:hypothetical protein [Commensalibacter intestini]EHD14306.1 hypothetical protein CIN_02380 [Commensalibacter intestini A911]
MNQKLDPKELKVLADILALVLEDQPGQSANALEAIKKRAKKNGTTGGALKNLFTNIANNPPTQSRASSTQSRKANNSEDLLKARSQISNLTQSINQLDASLRNLRRQNEALRSELLLTQRSRAEMQASLSAAAEKFPFRNIIILVALLCGLFCGIAGALVITNLTSTAHLPDNTIYLH